MENVYSELVGHLNRAYPTAEKAIVKIAASLVCYDPYAVMGICLVLMEDSNLHSLQTDVEKVFHEHMREGE